MTDPYQVLGVSPNASDEQIKAAYREMAKKYHPDQYADSPLADLAGEKMKEVNEAYDSIQKMRSAAKSGPTGGNSYSGSYTGRSTGSAGYEDVRRMLYNGRVADAEQILNGVPNDSRNAEWYFLKGTVLYRRGWLEEAQNHLERACRMDPNNAEYRAALNQLYNQQSGAYGGFYNRSVPYGNNDCNACDVCSSLMCADCCCECMGGDLIRCC